jgi:hypothetical protein
VTSETDLSAVTVGVPQAPDHLDRLLVLRLHQGGEVADAVCASRSASALSSARGLDDAAVSRLETNTPSVCPSSRATSRLRAAEAEYPPRSRQPTTPERERQR